MDVPRAADSSQKQMTVVWIINLYSKSSSNREILVEILSFLTGEKITVVFQ